MPEGFEVLDCSELPATSTRSARGPYKKRPLVIVDDFETLDERQIIEETFEPVAPDFDWSTMPDPNPRNERRKTVNRPVIFLDGEGANNGDRIETTRKQNLRRWVQKQNYALLGATIEPDEYRCIVGQDNVQQLSTKQCLDFILSLPADHIIVGFALTYDVEMWLRDVKATPFLDGRASPMERLMRTQSVWWKGYRIHYIPKKIFTVGKYRGKKRIVSRTVYDSFGFFQSSFKTAIREWKVGTEKQWEFIDRMKEGRPDFGAITDETKAYNHMEGIHGIQLFSRVREEYTKLGLSIARPVGAGSIASAMYRKHRILDYFPEFQLIPSDVMLSAFYGGRFDITRIGFVGTVFDADINSAYPHIARNLPCLRCGRYVTAKNYEPTPHSLWLVRWSDNGTRWSPFPYRSENGHIRYYRDGIGWYYDDEVSAALRFCGRSIEVIGGYQYVQNCNHRPFEFIEEYYQYRQQLVDAGDFGEKIIKLGLNSVYGKLSQSKGKNPPFQQMIWAAMITSGTRAMLLDGIRQAPDSVIKVATDAVFSTVPLDLEYDKSKLGAWKVESLHDLLVLGNGVYQATASDNPKHPHGVSRNRGFAKDVGLVFDWNAIRENYQNGITSVVRKREFRRFVKAFHEKKLEERCDWIESEHYLSLDIQKMKRVEGEYIYPLPNPQPNVISAPTRIKPENLKLPGQNHLVTDTESETE